MYPCISLWPLIEMLSCFLETVQHMNRKLRVRPLLGHSLCLSCRHDLIVSVSLFFASLPPSCSEEKLLKMPSHTFNTILPPKPYTGFNRFVPCFLPFCHYHNSSPKTSSCCIKIVTGKILFQVVF